MQRPFFRNIMNYIQTTEMMMMMMMMTTVVVLGWELETQYSSQGFAFKRSFFLLTSDICSLFQNQYWTIDPI